MAHLLLAIKNLNAGIDLLKPNFEAINRDNDKNYLVVAEGIQTILRREGILNSYNIVKEMTRGKSTSNKSMSEWIESLNIEKSAKDEIMKLVPKYYSGNSTW